MGNTQSGGQIVMTDMDHRLKSICDMFDLTQVDETESVSCSMASVIETRFIHQFDYRELCSNIILADI